MMYIAALGEYALPFVEYEFLTSGYIRIGSWTFFNALGISDPAPPPPPPSYYYVSRLLKLELGVPELSIIQMV